MCDIKHFTNIMALKWELCQKGKGSDVYFLSTNKLFRGNESATIHANLDHY